MYTRETVMGVLNHGKFVYFGPTHSAFSNIPAFYESYTDAPGERSVVLNRKLARANSSIKTAGQLTSVQTRGPLRNARKRNAQLTTGSLTGTLLWSTSGVKREKLSSFIRSKKDGTDDEDGLSIGFAAM